jgi:hypothetical protein
MAEGDAQKSFPKIPAKNWWELRRKFSQSLPKVANEDYLQSVLGLSSSRSAANLIAPLKAIGLIDDEYRPTDRAIDWRSDEHYAEVCMKILDEVYPSNLRDAFPPPKPDFEGVKAWFSRNAKVGNSAATAMAALYTLIAEGDPKAESQVATKPKPRPDSTRSPKMPPKPARATPAASGRTGIKKGTLGGNVGDEDWPTIHVDVQVHIAADASAEQIDALFESMARHLYRRS